MGMGSRSVIPKPSRSKVLIESWRQIYNEQWLYSGH